MFIIISILFFIILGSITGFLLYKRSHHFRKQVERSLKMVPFLVTVPQSSGREKGEGSRDQRDVARELISQAENFYYTLSSIYKKGFKNFIVGQKHIALEIVADNGEIFFYFAVPISLIGLVEKTISTQYPDCHIEEVEEHNIFKENQGLKGVRGIELVTKRDSMFPLKTYSTIELDPLYAITNALSKIEKDEGAAIQILIRPVGTKFAKGSRKMAEKIQKGEYKEKFKVGKATSSFASDIIRGATKGKDELKSQGSKPLTPLQEEMVKAVETKAGKPVFESIIRLVVSAKDDMRADMILNEMSGSFAQFNDLNMNQFKPKRIKDRNKLVTDYIFRFFGHTSGTILNTEELASIFHLPNYLVQTPGIKWLPAKRTAAPVQLLTEGVILGESFFRGEKKEVRIGEVDMRRHVYIIGQTGVGKTNTLKNMILDEIEKGHGICYIDPHGPDLEDVLSRIPKERAEDVIIFDAGDIERPMGLNLFDAKTTEQKDFVIDESIGMLYKLYDPGHTGIMGPRFEHWFRNAALAIMADPAGGSFIEVPRIFTDDKYLKDKLKFVTDPVVKNFWINEMGQTSDFHKSEVLGWFVGKFGAFMTNSTMRNILGQVNTTLKLREAMDNKKIVLINLSKGKIGELNMSLLGMIFVSKIQMAAMSRVDTPEEEREDFTLYVDEFQNFATDSFAAIMSEARKFKLRLVVANQFIGQLGEEIRDAVFGNVGTLISFRVGPEDAEFMTKQYAPVFDANDLVNIENYNAFIKLMINGVPSRPFNITGVPPSGTADKERGDAIRQLSRLKYARPKEEVDREVQEKLAIDPSFKNQEGETKEINGS